MKALTLWQAYLAGVLHGDGWCTDLTIGLRCKDHDFSAEFCLALENVFGIDRQPRRDERGYWLVRLRNSSGRFSHAKAFEPQTLEERAAWVRGFFDSEGNAQVLEQPKRGPRSIHRRISVCSTEVATIERVRGHFAALGIEVFYYVDRLRKGSKGKKPLHILCVKRRESFVRFATLVGSSIERKRKRLDRIAGSYLDRSTAAREAQLKGAAAKHAKLMNVTLPAVVHGVRGLIAAGVRPTQRACRLIAGYDSVQRYVRQADLIVMAGDP